MAEEKPKTWREAATESMEEAYSDAPVNTAKQIQALANALFCSVKDDETRQSDVGDYINRIALLSGTACSILLDYAKDLEARAAKKD